MTAPEPTPLLSKEQFANWVQQIKTGEHNRDYTLADQAGAVISDAYANLVDALAAAEAENKRLRDRNQVLANDMTYDGDQGPMLLTDRIAAAEDARREYAWAISQWANVFTEESIDRLMLLNATPPDGISARAEVARLTGDNERMRRTIRALTRISACSRCWLDAGEEARQALDGTARSETDS